MDASGLQRAPAGRPLRTVDVARRLGRSVQHVRDLERDGVLPSAARTPSGHRVHGEEHVRWGLLYRHLAAALGPVEGKAFARSARTGPRDGVLHALDEAHAHLHAEREALRLAREATAHIVAEPGAPARPADALTVAQLAAALDVRPPTLRHWESEGLLSPGRDATGARRYPPDVVRDARVVSELRRAGHGIPALRELMPALRAPGRRADLDAHLAARGRALDARSWALVRAAAELSVLLDDGAT